MKRVGIVVSSDTEVRESLSEEGRAPKEKGSPVDSGVGQGHRKRLEDSRQEVEYMQKPWGRKERREFKEWTESEKEGQGKEMRWGSQQVFVKKG